MKTSTPVSRWLALALVVPLVLSVFGCANRTAGGLPIVEVDQAHFQTTPADLNQAPAYVVRPGPGFILDATHYTFVVPAEAPASVNGPNMIQVVNQQQQIYTHTWDLSQTRYTLTAETLQSVTDASPFPGLKDGESVLVGIGHMEASGRFVVLWAGVLDVRANSGS